MAVVYIFSLYHTVFVMAVVANSRVINLVYWGCGGSVVERQAANPVVPGSNPGQSLQYQKISWVL